MNGSKEQMIQLGYAGSLLGMLISLFCPAYKLLFGDSESATDALSSLIGLKQSDLVMSNFKASTIAGLGILICIGVGVFFSFVKFNKLAIAIAPIVSLGLVGYDYIKVGQSAVSFGMSSSVVINVLPGFYVLLVCSILASLMGVIIAITIKE